jgi:hypothetical protein
MVKSELRGVEAAVAHGITVESANSLRHWHVSRKGHRSQVIR